MYYDMDGKPITIEEWSKLYAQHPGQPSPRRVAETTLPDGTWISTVLLGIDHGWGIGRRPVIFESMVFPAKDNMEALEQDRYCTKEEALEGHARLVDLYQSKDALEDVMKKRKPGKWGNE